MGRRHLIWETVSEPSDLIEGVHTAASLDKPLLCGERGLCGKILLALNSAADAPLRGSHRGRSGWGKVSEVGQ